MTNKIILTKIERISNSSVIEPLLIHGSNQMEIIFGMPSQKCARHGICKMEHVPFFSPFPMSFGRAAAYLVVQGQEATLFFLNESMSKGTLARHFVNNTFKVEENVHYSLKNIIKCSDKGYRNYDVLAKMIDIYMYAGNYVVA